MPEMNHHDLESALGALAPAPSVVSRDAVMYRAGEARERRRRLRWQTLATALAVAVCVSVLTRPAPRGPAVTSSDPLAALAKPVEDARPLQPAYLVLRGEVLERGLDALPSSEGTGSRGTMRVRDVIGEL